MSSSTFYKPASSKVIHEIFEGEVVIVNLESGSYYSLRNTGAAVWNALMRGASQTDIVAQIAQNYIGERALIEQGVNQLLSEMQTEGLIAPVTAERANAASAAPIAPPAPTENFQAPVLEKYSDMQDLLLLDPIHEVDDAGWPVAKKT